MTNRYGILGTFLLLFALGCQASATPGAACVRTSDCAAGLICGHGRCRPACRDASDCAPGQQCLLDQSGVGSCSLDLERGCASDPNNHACSCDLACEEDLCVVPCAGATDCAGGSVCRVSATGTDTYCFVGPANDAGTRADSSLPGCTGGMRTTLTGTVQLPNGDPVPNAIVYVPGGPVDPIGTTVSCVASCPATALTLPLAMATTGVDGRFTMNDPPVGSAVPLVVQLGRWRLQTTTNVMNPCTNNPIVTPFTLPGTSTANADVPHVLIATGGADAIECVLMKMGLPMTEFTTTAGVGHVHLVAGDGATLPGATSDTTLSTTANDFQRYDLVILANRLSASTPTAPQIANLESYTENGGRVLVMHNGYPWLQGSTHLAAAATWMGGQAAPSTAAPFPLDVTSTRVRDLSAWLTARGAESGTDAIVLQHPHADFTTTGASTLVWIEGPPGAPVAMPETQLISFDTPYGSASTCGSVVYSELDDPETTSTGTIFPAECRPGALSPDERVLELMILDLLRCT